ncbi:MULTISPECIES: CapA family protein [unclassified Oceanobacillus]|uniref:CapA family protein n=1 Tax=unclassified Oceanobacillus TaxID=2630292 RepID=UPI00300E3E12
MEIIIGADVVPTESNFNLFKSGQVKELLGSNLYNIWRTADFRIFNLEVPLTDQKNPIDKNGPNLIAPTQAIKGISALNPDLVTLANNHILDQGLEGLYSTQRLLKEHDIPSIGAGENINQASETYILTHHGISVGIYACAENEFTIATEMDPGANPFDPLESLDHIRKLKDRCDYVIVLYHGGKEHYRYPSPYLQKVCRKIAQKGADLVVCQHSHCVGAFEKFEGSTIIYGQGNFIFNKYNNEFWNNSILIKASFTDKFEVNYIPVFKTDQGIQLAEKKEAEIIISGFLKRSSEILEEGFVQKNYKSYAKENLPNYLRRLSGENRWLSGIDRRLLNNLLLKRKYKNDKLLVIENIIECESHRELILEGLKTVER